MATGLHLLEVLNIYSDAGSPVQFEIEVPANLLDITAAAVFSRLYIDANTNGQTMQPKLVYEDGTTKTLATFSTSGRATTEFAISETRRWVATRISHTGSGLTAVVEIFGIEVEGWAPSVAQRGAQ